MIAKRISGYCLIAGLVLSSALAQQVRLVNAFPHISFSEPIDLQNAGDGSGRLFVVEQAGVIKVVPNDSAIMSAATFLDIRSRVLHTQGSELGLLGLAFHPSFSDSGTFFVNYTAPNPRRTVIARFKVSAANPDSAVPSSELIILEITQPYDNHNAGQLAFGPDGYLYIATGDGGAGGDPLNVAQDRTSLLGKMLRIDISNPYGGKAYGIPPDNPYVGNQNGFREEIYAYGLRNPWRFSFDTTTQRLWCGDVGQSAREEIDIIEKGKNYGWRIMEGSICHIPSSGCDTSGLTLPVWDYGRSVGGSITGGIVYRGSLIPELVGKYVFGDFSSGYLAALTVDGIPSPFVTTLDTLPQFRLTSFGTDESRELYACLHDGSILRIEPAVISSVPLGGLPPRLLHLEQNYPNPFNASTVIRFQVSDFSMVTITIHDILGRTLSTLVNRQLIAGEHVFKWDAGKLPSGPYFLRLSARTDLGVQMLERRMLLLR